MKKQPFEGLLGDTCETRLLQFLLPMYGIAFDMAELTLETGLTRQSVAKAMKKFSDRDMVKVQKKGRTWLYSINEESPLVKRLEDFDNTLIESMVGIKEFEKICAASLKPIAPVGIKQEGEERGTARIHADESGSDVPCVASRNGTYRTRK